jgi:hypothetical protein
MLSRETYLCSYIHLHLTAAPLGGFGGNLSRSTCAWVLQDVIPARRRRAVWRRALVLVAVVACVGCVSSPAEARAPVPRAAEKVTGVLPGAAGALAAPHRSFFTATGAVPCTSPSGGTDPNVADPSGPHGLFVFGGEGEPWFNSDVANYLVNNPDICGITIPLRWARIDRGPSYTKDRYAWGYIDALMAPWVKAGKTVNLLFGGAGEQPGPQLDTPAWVQSQVTMINCGGKSEPTPVFWQAGYEKNWEFFIAKVVQHYAGDPNIGYMRFGIGTADEGVLMPALINTPACASLWDAAGYQTGWPEYNKQLIAMMGSLKAPFDLQIGLNNATDFPSMGANAKKAYSLGIGIGVESLASKDAGLIIAGKPCSLHNWCRVYDSYAGKLDLHIQTFSASTPAGGAKETGPLPPLVQAALDVHAQILEIYVEDYLLAFDPNWSGYATYHSAYAAAFDKAAAVVGVAP